MSLHLKRLASPRAWQIPKKSHVWAPKTLPGPHGRSESLPLLLILRDYLKVCDTAAEAKRIVTAGQVIVDGKKAVNIRQGVGFMDVVSLPDTGANYRILFDTHGRLMLTDVPQANASWKLCRVEGKTTVAGGKTQVNLHDGRNFLVKEAGQYKTGDTIKLRVPDQTVMGHFPLGEGATAVITGGRHIGQVASVKELETVRGSAPNLVSLLAGAEEFSTVKPYVFVVGKEKAEIQLPTGGM